MKFDSQIAAVTASSSTKNNDNNNRDICKSKLLARSLIAQRRPATAIQEISKLHSQMQSLAADDKNRHYQSLSELEVIRSLAFLEMRELDEALLCVDEALNANPNSALAHVSKGRILAQMNDNETAKKHYQIAIDIDEQCVEARFYLAQQHYRTGDIDAAIGEAKRILLNSSVYEVHLLLGVLYESRGDMRAAKECYMAAVSVGGEARAEALVFLAWLYIASGQMETAEVLTKDAIRRDVKYSPAWSLWGCILGVNGNVAAREAFERALDLDSKSLFNLHCQAQYEALQENWQQVLQLCDRAIKYHPNRASLYVLKGQAHYCLVQYDEAQVCFDRAIELDKRSSDAYQSYFQILLKIGQYDRLLDLVEQSQQHIDKFAYAEYAAATTLALMCRYECALERFDRACAYDHEFLDAYYGKISCLIACNRTGEAQKILESQVQLRVDHVRYHLAWYKVYRSNGNARAAAPYLNAAAQLSLNDHVIWINKAILAFELEDYEAALSAFNWVLQLKPDHSSALIHRGDTLLQLNRHEEALASYDEALQKSVLSLPSVLKSKIQLYKKIGNELEASAAQQQLYQLSLDNPENANQTQFMNDFLNENEIQLNEQRLKDFKSGKLSFD